MKTTPKPNLPKGMQWIGKPEWVAGAWRGNVKSKRAAPKRASAPTIEEIATQFVNLGGSRSLKRPVEDFVRSHPSLRLTRRAAAIRALQLRKAWNLANREFAERLLEEIFAAPRASVASSPDRYAPVERAAFKIRLGRSKPVFEPRGLLDKIAFAILKASERGLLRMCRGFKRGWRCPTPYLVADEKRRVYCYSRCGDQAKSRAKLKWWRKTRKERESKQSKQSRKGGGKQ